jgi:hypothetical protein
MIGRRARLFATVFMLAAGLLACRAQSSAPPAGQTDAPQTVTSPDPSSSPVYVCPMDRDIRAYAPGTCPRCGMTLQTSIPEPAEYRLVVNTGRLEPGRPAHLTFEFFDPWKGNRVSKFSLVHEKLLHAFVVSRDLQFFEHDHPSWTGERFEDDLVLPKPGMYRVLADMFPEAATPQLLVQTIFVPGEEPPRQRLSKDDTAKRDHNLTVSITTNPPEPVAGEQTQLRLTLSPADGIERLLGAWGHMLAASEDLIDLMHEHPSSADGGSEMQFSLIFPRAGIYRVWTQFQRQGIVNTVHFDVPVLPAAAHATEVAASHPSAS